MEPEVNEAIAKLNHEHTGAALDALRAALAAGDYAEGDTTTLRLHGGSPGYDEVWTREEGFAGILIRERWSTEGAFPPRRVEARRTRLRWARDPGPLGAPGTILEGDDADLYT